MSVGSNDLFSLLAVPAAAAAERRRFVKISRDLLVVLNCSLLFFFVSFFFFPSFRPRMRRRLKGSKTDSMRLKSIRPGFGVKYFGFLHIDRCFFLFLFLRRALT